jgi:cytochrome c-type biogenesis protein CcmH
MSFWIAAILFTALAVLSVMLPLLRRPKPAADAAANDLEVYRDQLAEIDRDAERGLIGATEKEEARAEIARRILRAAEKAGRARAAAAPGLRLTRIAAFAAVISVPLVSWGIYSLIGSPDLPSQPLAARLSIDPAEASIEELVARAEAHLVASPDDGRGWDVLAPIYFRIGRYADAAEAYRRAAKLLGPTANREAGLGEALAAEAGGLITADSKAAFERALALEPHHPKSEFFLASGLAQEGRIAEAAGAWKTMRQRLPADSPWLGAVDEALAEAGRRLAANDGGDGPTAADIEAASQMSATDRQAMIETMVVQLDERLKENPRDLEGWRRLMRSYVVLGRTDAAADALSRGVAAFGAQSAEANELQAFAASLGLARAE